MPKRASGIDVPRLAGDDALRRGGEVARRNARHVLGWPLWRKALVAFSLGFAALGVAVATLSDSALFGLYNRALAMRFFGVETLPRSVAALKAFIFGPIGGTIAGKWVAVAALVVVGFRHRERWAWRGATASLLLWFAIESTLSAVHGAWFNIYLIDLMPLVSVGTLLILARGELDVVEAAPAIPREQAFWHHWLFSACVAFTLFGLVSATSSQTALFGFYNRALAQRFFASDELPAIAVAFQRFAFVPLGGTIAGQFVALAYLARYPIRRGERWAIDASIASLLAWFIVDSSVTAYHRAWFNLLMVNLPTLLVMLPPLLVLRQTGRAA